MEITKVKSIPKIRRVSEFDAPLEDVVGRIMKDPTSIWKISDGGSGLPSRFKSRQRAGEFAGVTIKSIGKSVYLTAVEA